MILQAKFQLNEKEDEDYMRCGPAQINRACVRKIRIRTPRNPAFRSLFLGNPLRKLSSSPSGKLLGDYTKMNTSA